MAKQFESFGNNVVRKEDFPTVPTTTEEVRPFLATRDRIEYKSQTGYEMAPKDFNVWFVETEMILSSKEGKQSPEADTELFSAVKQPRDEASQARYVHVQAIPQRELKHFLNSTYIGRGEVRSNELPDLVLVSGGIGYIDNDEPRPLGNSLAKAYLQYETQAIRDIRNAAGSVLHLPGIESGDPVDDGQAFQFLESDILGNVYFQSTFEKQPITDELALENICSRLFTSDRDWDIAARNFDAYTRTGDDSLLQSIVTPGRIRKAVESGSKFSPQWFMESLTSHGKFSSKKSLFESDAAALEYHRALTEHMHNLVSEVPADDLQKLVFETFKKLIDTRKNKYIYNTEAHAAEYQLIQPLVVATGPSELYLNAALEAGADAVLKEVSKDDIQKLVTLTNRIRTSPASISSERLRRNKHEFYRFVVDQIESRSKLTADTEQELSILKSIFEQNGAKKILDVGSGYGRLAVPLAQVGYEVTGLEVNSSFLAKAKGWVGRNRRAKFKAGDLIDYTDVVPREEYDAVYYGWHSFLEAYGLGNSLTTLRSARMTLKPGGTVTFDQPSRENPGLEDGWYGDEEHGYLAYLMSEDELRFLLRLAGFENIEILKWTTKPSALHPEGMKKITVTAHKPKFNSHLPGKEKAPSVEPEAL